MTWIYVKYREILKAARSKVNAFATAIEEEVVQLNVIYILGFFIVVFPDNCYLNTGFLWARAARATRDYTETREKNNGDNLPQNRPNFILWPITDLQVFGN